MYVPGTYRCLGVCRENYRYIEYILVSTVQVLRVVYSIQTVRIRYLYGTGIIPVRLYLMSTDCGWNRPPVYTSTGIADECSLLEERRPGIVVSLIMPSHISHFNSQHIWTCRQAAEGRRRRQAGFMPIAVSIATYVTYSSSTTSTVLVQVLYHDARALQLLIHQLRSGYCTVALPYSYGTTVRSLLLNLPLYILVLFKYRATYLQ